MNVSARHSQGNSKEKSNYIANEHVLSHDERDRAILARVGKKQVLKRRFGFLSILSFSCTILVTWEGVLVLFATGFTNGGTVGLIGQFLFVWVGTCCTFVTMGELASMAPTAGGQYHWVAILAPRSIRNFTSYMTAWMTILAWVATVSTGTFLAATMIQALCAIDWPAYMATYARWQGTLMTWAVVLVCVFFNTVIGNLLPQVEGAFLIVHVLGFFAILIPLTYYAPHSSASEVFLGTEAYMNTGDWPTYGLSFMVGILGAAFSFVGADAAVHMSEEISNAAINVPRSIVISIVINGSLGFGMLIAVIFSIGDPNAALQAQASTGFPFIEIFQSATGSTSAATGMAAIVISLTFASTIGFLATGSRMIWSFARDKGLPFSAALSKVYTRSTIPVLAVIVTSIIPCLLVLINIGSTVVFNDVTSLALVGFYSTYFICCILLLYRRITGAIRDPPPSDNIASSYRDVATGEYVLAWGPWHLKGWLGHANNIIAVCYLFVVWLFGFFPPDLPVQASNMNFASVVFGFIIIFSSVYYVIWGRKQYHGPIIEITTLELDEQQSNNQQSTRSTANKPAAD